MAKSTFNLFLQENNRYINFFKDTVVCLVVLGKMNQKKKSKIFLTKITFHNDNAHLTPSVSYRNLCHKTVIADEYHVLLNHFKPHCGCRFPNSFRLGNAVGAIR